MIDQDSKFDTVFLCRSASPTVDLSQYHGDLTDEGGGIYTSLDSRFGLSSPREISVVIDATNADAGVLCAYTDVGWTSTGYLIYVNAGTVFFFVGGGVVATLSLPGVGAGAQSFLIHWSTIYDQIIDPVTPTYQSEMMVLNRNTGASSIVRAYHAAPPTDPTWKFCLTGFHWDGTAKYSNTIEAARLGARFHSTVEAREDWYLESPVPSITGRSPAVLPSPELDSPYVAVTAEDLGTAIAGTNAFAGPALYWGAIVSGIYGQLRLLSPLVNESTPNGMELSKFIATFGWHRDAPSADGYRMPLSYLYSRTIPIGCNAAKVRLHVQCYLSAGPPIGTAMDFRFRAVAMSKLPSQGGVLSWQQTQTVAVTTNHGTLGIGQWIDLGLLSLPVPAGELCFFAIAYSVPAGTGDTYRLAKIKHVTFEPVLV